MLQLLYIEELLEAVKKTFCELVNPSGLPNPRQIDYAKFNGAAFAPAFQKLHDSIEAQHMARKAVPKAMRTFAETDRGKKLTKEGKLKKREAKKKSGALSASSGDGEEVEEETDEPEDDFAEDAPPQGAKPQAPAAVTPTLADQELEEV